VTVAVIQVEDPVVTVWPLVTPAQPVTDDVVTVLGTVVVTILVPVDAGYCDGSITSTLHCAPSAGISVEHVNLITFSVPSTFAFMYVKLYGPLGPPLTSIFSS